MKFKTSGSNILFYQETFSYASYHAVIKECKFRDRKTQINLK